MNGASEDLAFVSGRIAGYRAYGEEADRHDSDSRVRAYVGEALTSAQTRLGATFSARAKTALEAVLYRCMFPDQVFVRNIEHAHMEAPLVAALVHSDRLLVEYADRAKMIGAEELLALLDAIEAQYDYRRSPTPLA